MSRHSDEADDKEHEVIAVPVPTVLSGDIIDASSLSQRHVASNDTSQLFGNPNSRLPYLPSIEALGESKRVQEDA